MQLELYLSRKKQVRVASTQAVCRFGLSIYRVLDSKQKVMFMSHSTSYYVLRVSIWRRLFWKYVRLRRLDTYENGSFEISALSIQTSQILFLNI